MVSQGRWSLRPGNQDIFDFYSLTVLIHVHVQRWDKNSIHIDLYTGYGINQTKLTSIKSIKSCLHLVEAIVDYYSPVAVIHYDNGLNCDQLS